MSHDLRHAIVAILPRLRRFALGLTGSEDEADDLVQAACERAISRLDQWQAGPRIDSWLYRIAQTIHIDRRRREGRRNGYAASVRAVQGGEYDGEQAVHAHMTLNAVRRALAALPAEQQVVVTLICVEGYSYREASETLGLPLGTVTSRLVRGRMTLCRLLGLPARTGEGRNTAESPEEEERHARAP